MKNTSYEFFIERLNYYYCFLTQMNDESVLRMFDCNKNEAKKPLFDIFKKVKDNFVSNYNKECLKVDLDKAISLEQIRKNYRIVAETLYQEQKTIRAMLVYTQPLDDALLHQFRQTIRYYEEAIVGDYFVPMKNYRIKMGFPADPFFDMWNSTKNSRAVDITETKNINLIDFINLLDKLWYEITGKPKFEQTSKLNPSKEVYFKIIKFTAIEQIPKPKHGDFSENFQRYLNEWMKTRMTNEEVKQINMFVKVFTDTIERLNLPPEAKKFEPINTHKFDFRYPTIVYNLYKYFSHFQCLRAERIINYAYQNEVIVDKQSVDEFLELLHYVNANRKYSFNSLVFSESEEEHISKNMEKQEVSLKKVIIETDYCCHALLKMPLSKDIQYESLSLEEKALLNKPLNYFFHILDAVYNKAIDTETLKSIIKIAETLPEIKTPSVVACFFAKRKPNDTYTHNLKLLIKYSLFDFELNIGNKIYTYTYRMYYSPFKKAFDWDAFERVVGSIEWYNGMINKKPEEPKQTSPKPVSKPAKKVDILKETRKYTLLGESDKYLGDKLAVATTIGYIDDSPLDSGLRDAGNIILSVDQINRDKEIIANFTMSYIMRALETSAITSINVSVLDNSNEWLFKRFKNCFDKKGTTEGLGKIFNITNSAEDLFSKINVHSEDISQKLLSLPLTEKEPDFYRLYEVDKNDALQIVVIYTSFLNILTETYSDSANILKEFIKTNGKGHKTGFRFFIVDDVSSNANQLPDYSKNILKTIFENCEYKIVFDGDKFTANNRSFKPISMNENLDAFVANMGDKLADAVLNKQENVIYYDRIGFGNVTHEEMGPTISVPIGLCGTDIVSVPLSCSDPNNSAEGSNIGFMVIGASGSGKSTFMHSLIINACMKYSPKDLQFWLLDFKSGNATEKYLKANIPHIHIVTENNKVDDAFSIFNMLLDEMERRNNICKRNNCSDVYSYNQYVKKNPSLNLEYLPRIVICVDEIQELFVDEQSNQLAQLIGQISTRMRSSGMHFVFISQNLSMNKTSYLDDAFLKHANGRVCFRIADKNTVRDSHYPEEYVNRADELRTLSTCTAFVSYGPNTIKKVNICRCTDELFKKYFDEIRKAYSDFKCETLIIGSKKKLTLNSNITLLDKSYAQYISSQDAIVYAENTYTLLPVELKHTPANNSSILFLGSNNAIMSSLCASFVVGALKNNGAKAHLFNGQKTLKFINAENKANILDLLSKLDNPSLNIHKSSELKSFMYEMVLEYRRRMKAFDNDEEYDYYPISIVINDLFAIRDVKDNVELNAEEKDSSVDDFDSDNLSAAEMIARLNASETQPSSSEQININMINALKEIMLDGYRVNIFMACSIKEQDSGQNSYMFNDLVNNIGQKVYFNNAPYVECSGNTYYLNEMLKNIFGGEGKIDEDGAPEETLAVLCANGRLTKIRPLIINEDDLSSLEKIVRNS